MNSLKSLLRIYGPNRQIPFVSASAFRYLWHLGNANEGEMNLFSITFCHCRGAFTCGSVRIKIRVFLPEDVIVWYFADIT